MIIINRENFSRKIFGDNIVKGNPNLVGDSKIKIVGKNNTLIFGEGVKIIGVFLLYGDNATIKIGKNSKINGKFSLSGFSTLEMGSHILMTKPSYFSVGNHNKITVGDYCTISDIICYSTDWHPIRDAGGKIINESADITIEDRVLLVRQAFLAKGARIGRGSVIGARSLVAGKIPNNCIAAGMPARVIREDISWSDTSRHPFKPDLTAFSNKSLKFSRRMLWKVASCFKKIGVLSEESLTDFCRRPTDKPCQPGLIGKLLFLSARKTEAHTLKLLNEFDPEDGYRVESVTGIPEK
jgi:acetyltransferase-like isoleucine patch superfamily enzyme